MTKVKDRIEQRHKKNLETERTLEQLQRWNSGNNNIAPDKSIRKDNLQEMATIAQQETGISGSRTRKIFKFYCCCCKSCLCI